jgi:hypothetical protein
MNENLYLKTLTPSTKAGLWGGGGGRPHCISIKTLTTIQNT